jgi:hypothetical protein
LRLVNKRKKEIFMQKVAILFNNL